MDEIYILKAGTEVFSIALQENVKFCEDVIVKITNTILGNDDYVFAKLQLHVKNWDLSFAAGKNMSSFIDKTNGDIGLLKTVLIKYES
jgi:hypothetical protein